MNRLLAVCLVSLAAVVSVSVASPAYADATDDLFEAAWYGTASEVKAALADGADPGAREDSLGDTPLHRAARDNPNPSVITALIEAGADPGAHNRRGFTPLHKAARNPNPSVITALIEGGADPGARGGVGGITPLHGAAALNPNPSVILALIEGGADPGARDDAGRVPFDYAEKNVALKGTEAYRLLKEGRFE